MVWITEELIRKKSEHNEGIIGTLEELSLHQEDVEKIEHINNWCKNIQILYLQANLIPKIENLNKLKKLEYLNLAINNIEKIENLEGCEFLEKLDLTLNFIGDLESVCSLQCNTHLKHLYLTGNPCCDFDCYRQYVVAKLPKLQTLDGTDITRSERIKAQQNLSNIEPNILEAQEKYRTFRETQKKRAENSSNSLLTDDEFWKSSSEHSPETRVEIARRAKKTKELDKSECVEKKKVALFTRSGRPLNVNQGKLKFKFNDEDAEQYILDLEVYKYLDTTLIDIDLQPIYVRIAVKGKIFQIVFPEEIHVEKSVAKRSQTTGNLVLHLPKVNYKKTVGKSKKSLTCAKPAQKASNFLDVEEKASLDFSKIVVDSKKAFHDDPQVPPLEFG